MDTQLAVREYRLQQWAGRIKTCRSSGMTVSAWCAENGVNPKSYYYWLKKVRTAALEEKCPNSQFVQVNMEQPVCGRSASIILRASGCELELREGTSTELIERTLRAIRNVW